MATGKLKVNAGINVGSSNSDPSGGQDGDMYYNTTTNVMRKHVNGAWHDFAFSVADIPSVTALTDGTNVALDASTGKTFTLTSTLTNPAIAAPTNPVDGQKILIKYKNSNASSVTLGLNAAFVFGSDVTGLTATPTGTMDYIGCEYDGTAAKWRVIAYSKGY